MKRRIISVLLVLVMALTLLPTAAFATEEDVAAPAERQEPVCVCEAACTEEAMNADCPICGAEGAHTHDCARYQDGEKPAVSGAAQPGAEPEKQPEGEEKPQPETPDAAQPDTGAPDADEPEESAAQENMAVQSDDQGIALLAADSHTHCFCGGSVTAGDHNDHSQSITYKACTNWKQLKSPWVGSNSVAYVYLENDITADNADIYLSIQQGRTLYLCLNGHTLDLGDNYIWVGQKGATLYLCDCSAKKTGTVSGGSRGCVSVDDNSNDNATFNMYGGTLRDGNRPKGGGVGIVNGTMNMYGGTITENTATRDGGGIFVNTTSTLNLYGGTITKNTVNTNEGHYGGGVYVESNEWSGVGKISISGSPVITGNTRTITIDSKATTTTDNLYLQYAFYNKGKLPTIELGTLTDGADIGIWAGQSIFSTASETDYSEYFSSDEGGYHVAYNQEKKLELVPGAATPTYTLIFDANGGTGAPDKLKNTGGNSFTVPATKPTKTGYDFAGWALTNTAAEAAYQPGATIAITSGKSMTLYAVWKSHAFTAEKAEEQYLKSAATCTAKAVYYKSCTACGLSSKDTGKEATFESGNVLGHNWGQWTQNSDGSTHTRTCSRNTSHTETGNCSVGKATCIARAKCNVCKAESGEKNPHNHAGTLGGWQSDENEHWKEYSCCRVRAEEDSHNWDNGTVTKQPTCTTAGERKYTCAVCSATKTDTIPATGHSWKREWTSDATHHWHKCANQNCDVKVDSGKDGYAPHTGGEATCTAQAVCATCNQPYGALNSTNHDWNEWKSNGDDTHTRVCARDAAHTETKNCHGGTADCTHKPVCEDCGAEYGEL